MRNIRRNIIKTPLKPQYPVNIMAQTVNTLAYPVNVLKQTVNVLSYPINTLLYPFNILQYPVNILTYPINTWPQKVNFLWPCVDWIYHHVDNMLHLFEGKRPRIREKWLLIQALEGK